MHSSSLNPQVMAGPKKITWEHTPTHTQSGTSRKRLSSAHSWDTDYICRAGSVSTRRQFTDLCVLFSKQRWRKEAKETQDGDVGILRRRGERKVKVFFEMQPNEYIQQTLPVFPVLSPTSAPGCTASSSQPLHLLLLHLAPPLMMMPTDCTH